jgi:hypothetical protein
MKNEICELKKQNKLIEEQNKMLKDKIDNFNPKNNQFVKIHKSIKKLETTIPANTNLTISNQYLEKIIQKEKEIEEIVNQKEKEEQFIIVKNNVKNNNLYDDNFDYIIDEIEEKEHKNEKVEDKPMTLILDNNIIQCRKSDGYINATQLCSAGGKLFGNWYRLDSTKQLIIELAKQIFNKNLKKSKQESDIHICISQAESLLIDIKKGNNLEKVQGTWIHPDLAIQLAQWLSPSFALQVSLWIRTLFVEGKVEANIKLLKQKDNEIKDKDKRIKHLEQKILKKIPTPKYDDSKFVVYLATNKHCEKERKYTIGLAIDLSKRISSYNKLEDHYPIYYKSFKDEEQMKLAESMVLNKLYDYRMLESKDRFMLPLGKDIKLFTKAIDDAHIFFNN